MGHTFIDHCLRPGCIYGNCCWSYRHGRRLVRRVVAFGLFFVLSPFWFPFYFMYQIGRLFLKNKLDEETIYMILLFAGLESSLEALPQLVLQLHTILNGYETTWIQIISIVSSFSSIAIASTTADMEFTKGRYKVDDTTMLKKVKMFGARLPCYMTTILFRAMALMLTISYLRAFSIIPIFILFAEVVAVSTQRIIKTEQTMVGKIRDIASVSITNMGSMSVYGVSACYDEEGEKLNEDDDAVTRFIKTSSIMTTGHHFIVLTTITIMGTINPTYFEHWESSNFQLRPATDNFYWTFCVTIALGIYSLILLLYRAKKIIQFETPKTQRSEQSNV